jgi:TRAP transporter 4TM/12TM fusion protein
VNHSTDLCDGRFSDDRLNDSKQVTRRLFMRTLKNRPSIFIVTILALAASFFHIYTAGFGLLDPRLQRATHLFLLLPMAFLLYPATKKSPEDRFTIADAICAVLIALPSLLIVIDYDRICQRWENVTPLLPIEFIFGIIMVVLLIEAVRRAVTPVLAYLMIIALLYMKLGTWFPTILGHRGVDFPGLVELMYMLADEGVYGMLTGISATYIFIFILFGSFINGSGAGDFFSKLATAAFGTIRGGPALVAVSSSALFGTLTGSSVANVFGTGTFTIPLMKRLGYSSEFSGAVEAAASTGGQYMPPVMGAAAFIMAEMIGIPYITIALCASISACLYFVSIGFMVYFRACREDLKGLPKEEIPLLGEALKDIYLLIPIVLLFYMLIKGYSPIMSGFVATLVTIAVTWIRPSRGMRLKKIYVALVDAGKNAVLVAVACAGTGMIVSVVTHTGLGLTFSNSLVRLSGGNIIVTMFLIMCASLVLGHGAPTSATYVLIATVGAGAMVKLGANIIAAHLFCLYYAVIADITPPVAVAAYAGASIAKGDPFRTGIEAFKLAFAGFIVPIIFVLNPALVLQGPWYETIHVTFTALIGIVALAGGIQGWFKKNLNRIERIILFAAALGLLDPSLLTDILGACVLLAFLLRGWLQNKWKRTQPNDVG